jgi:PPOX class probable F420-dependent enzyme
MNLETAMSFVQGRDQGVLVTLSANGRPQLSNILYTVDPGWVIRISVTDTRTKTKNLRRDPRASLYVLGENFWQWVVVDADAELSAVAAREDDESVNELVDLYRNIRGEDHPNWDEYRRSMTEERRLVIRLKPHRGYGLLAS